MDLCPHWVGLAVKTVISDGARYCAFSSNGSNGGEQRKKK